MPISDEERAALTTELEKLTARIGVTRMREAPLVEPTSAYFPDAFVPGDDASAATLARRIFEYAGLGEVAITLEPRVFNAERDVRDPVRAGDDGVERVHQRTGPADLVSVGEVACTIAFDASDAVTLAGALCRVAGRVFLERRLETYRDSPSYAVTTTTEALRAGEIASVFLGFGIVTANDAYRFVRSKKHLVTHRTCGVLSYEAMAFVLAAWWRHRGSHSREGGRIRASLDANQCAAFDEFAS